MLNGNLTIPKDLLGGAFRATELLGGVSPNTEKFLTSITDRRLFPSDTIVLENDRIPDGVFILVDGDAALVDGNGRQLRSVDEGEICGLTEIVAELPSELGVQTVTPCRFDFVSKDDFVLFLRTEPEICFRLLKMLGANLQYIYRILAN